MAETPFFLDEEELAPYFKGIDAFCSASTLARTYPPLLSKNDPGILI